MLLQADKRHSYKTLKPKRPDKEEVCIIWKSGCWALGDLLGSVLVVGEEGLWGANSWASEELLSPSDSHSEEAGEESEDVGEEEEEEEE